MKIAFVFPRYSQIDDQPTIKAVAENYGIYPPINLAYVAGIARNAGHEIIFIDGNAEKLSNAKIVARLKRFNPDAVLFTITTYLFHEVLSAIRYIKQNMDVITIVGGVHLTYYAKETLSHPEIDIAVIGDAENTLPKLLDAIEKAKAKPKGISKLISISKVKNICFQKNQKNGKSAQVQVTGKGEQCNFLEGVYPVRDLLPNSRYYEFISQRKNFTGMITSKGCPFKCTYCEQGKLNWHSFRKIPDVINEIIECYSEHKVREIDFFDPIFTLNRKRTLEICSEIRKLRLDLDFAVRTRTDCIDDEVLRNLRLAGCKRIYYGIETADPTVMKNINKQLTLGAIKSAITKTKNNRIDTFGYFMFGNPGDTLSTIRKTARFSRNIGLDFSQYNKVIPMAGSQMYDQLSASLGYDFWKKYTLEKTKPSWRIPKVDVSASLSDKTIDKEVASAFKRFYFRPSHIAKRLVSVKSTEELMRYVKAGISFLR